MRNWHTRAALGLAFVTCSGAGGLWLGVFRAGEPGPALPAAAQTSAPSANASELSALEAEALRRFPGTPKVKLHGASAGTTPRSESESRAIKLEVLRAALLREALAANPNLEAEATQRVRRNSPMIAMVGWSDANGEHELRKVVADTRGCGLSPEVAFSTRAAQLESTPCLNLESLRALWQGDVELNVTPYPITDVEPEWSQLVRAAMKDAASEAYLAGLEQSKTAAATP